MLHEFWSQYDPSQKRLHLFFEGHDDVIFFRFFVTKYVDSAVRVLNHRCDGKSKVFEAFEDIMRKRPNARGVLFFVDKDIDDILGTAWPTDPRIFVTDVYSIENYLVRRPVLQRFYRDAIRLNRVTFDDEDILKHFDEQHRRFQRMMIGVMAWIVSLRRAGERPNLGDINLGEVCAMDGDCKICPSDGNRLEYLSRVTQSPARAFKHIAPIAKHLKRIPAERIVRGKFEIWFIVEFWRRLVDRLRALAAEGGGGVTIKHTLDRNTVVAALTPYTDIPRSLELFLESHLSRTDSAPPRQSRQTLIEKIWSAIRGRGRDHGEPR